MHVSFCVPGTRRHIVKPLYVNLPEEVPCTPCPWAKLTRPMFLCCPGALLGNHGDWHAAHDAAAKALHTINACNDKLAKGECLATAVQGPSISHWLPCVIVPHASVHRMMVRMSVSCILPCRPESRTLRLPWWSPRVLRAARA